MFLYYYILFFWGGGVSRFGGGTPPEQASRKPYLLCFHIFSYCCSYSHYWLKTAIRGADGRRFIALLGRKLLVLVYACVLFKM